MYYNVIIVSPKVQVSESNTGPTRVHSRVNNRPQTDYEDIDDPSPNHTHDVPLPTNSRNNDYSRTPCPHDMNAYAIPFQTQTKVK